MATTTLTASDIILKRHRTIPVVLDDDTTFDVTYNPSAYEHEIESEFMRSFDAKKPAEATFKLLSTLMVGWSLKDKYTAETLNSLGFFIHEKALTAIQEDMAGGPNPKKD